MDILQSAQRLQLIKLEHAMLKICQRTAARLEKIDLLLKEFFCLSGIIITKLLRNSKRAAQNRDSCAHAERRAVSELPR